MTTERCGRHRDRYLAEDIAAVALEELVLLHRDEDEKIAGWSAAQASITFARKPDARAVVDAGWDVAVEL